MLLLLSLALPLFLSLRPVWRLDDPVDPRQTVYT
jgi:hypothetical protein